MKRFSKFIEEAVELDEKLKATDKMGDWVKDFQDSDAPQFKGKSQKKRQQMAVAAKLSAERNESVEQIDEAKIKVGDIVKPSKSSAKTMKVTDIVRVPYMGRKETFVDGIDDQGNKIRRPLRSVVKEEAELDEISKKTLGSYVKKASDRVARNTADYTSVHSGEMSNRGTFKDRLDYKKELSADTRKRKAGIDKALNRLTKEEVELDEQAQYDLVEAYLLENNIDIDSLTEEELNELIGKVIGGAFKAGAKAVVGAGRLAKKAANRMSTDGRAAAAEKRADAAEKRNKDRERIEKARQRLRDAQKAAREAKSGTTATT